MVHVNKVLKCMFLSGLGITQIRAVRLGAIDPLTGQNPNEGKPRETPREQALQGQIKYLTEEKNQLLKEKIAAEKSKESLCRALTESQFLELPMVKRQKEDADRMNKYIVTLHKPYTQQKGDSAVDQATYNTIVLGIKKECKLPVAAARTQNVFDAAATVSYNKHKDSAFQMAKDYYMWKECCRICQAYHNWKFIGGSAACHTGNYDELRKCRDKARADHWYTASYDSCPESRGQYQDPKFNHYWPGYHGNLSDQHGGLGCDDQARRYPNLNLDADAARYSDIPRQYQVTGAHGWNNAQCP